MFGLEWLEPAPSARRTAIIAEDYALAKELIQQGHDPFEPELAFFLQEAS